MIATAYVAFARLVELGKQDLAYTTPLAKFTIRLVLDGRRAGSSKHRNDVMFDAKSESDAKLIRRPDRIDDLHEALVEDHHEGPAETAAARIDLAGWLRSLPARNRRIAKALSVGESTKDVAKRFRVSQARVSQLRRELETSWLRYHGESCATIRRLGFSLFVMPEREPLAFDWDEPPHAEPPRPFRRRRQRVIA